MARPLLAQKSTLLRFGVLFLIVILLPLLVWGISKTTFLKPKAAIQSPTTQRLRVIEVRYFPKGPNAAPNNPDVLSSQLQAYLRSASTHHKQTVPAINPEVVAVYNHNSLRPNPNKTWQGSFQKVLDDNGLCTKIKDLDIDQVWLWVDAKTDHGPGVEYAISSSMFQKGHQFATVAKPALCGGGRSFIMMGFDYSRKADQALHSFGHMMEGVVGNLQTVDLFWYRFTGDLSKGYMPSERCGKVHFPPNTHKEYEYNSKTNIKSRCDDWKPDNTGQLTSINCQNWGCTEAGYLEWWFKRMPNRGSTLTYQNKKLPNWWDFIIDIDYSIPAYYKDTNYFLNRAFLDHNSPLPVKAARLQKTVTPTPKSTAINSPTPLATPILTQKTPTPIPVVTPTPANSCVGRCFGDTHDKSYSIGHSCLGLDKVCYVCGVNGSFATSQTACRITPTPKSSH